MEHKRALDSPDQNTGNKKFFELNPSNNEDAVLILLQMLVSKEPRIEEFGPDYWTTDKIKEIFDEHSGQEAMRFYVSNKFYIGLRKSNGKNVLSSVHKFIELQDGKFLHVRRNIEASNSGRFQLRIYQDRENFKSDDWMSIGHKQRIPVWDTETIGPITGEEVSTTKNWNKLFNTNTFGYYIVETVDIDGNQTFTFDWFDAEFIQNLPSNMKSIFDKAIGEYHWSATGVRIAYGKDLEVLSFEEESTTDTEKSVMDAINNNSETPNILLYGPPGTGKTFLCQRILSQLRKQPVVNYDIESRVFLNKFGGSRKSWWVTFHQSVSYEDFILGLRPQIGNEGGMELTPRTGPLLEAMLFAKQNNGKNHSVVFIDEINRGDLSRIFGDFITYMDTDKRAVVGENGIQRTDFTLPLVFPALNPRDGDRNRSEPIIVGGKKTSEGIELDDGAFIVPPNLTIIATMNSLDRSVAPMDSAMKRRFYQVNLRPDPDVIGIMSSNSSSPKHIIYLAERVMVNLNTWLEQLFGNDDIQIGHSYFKGITDIQRLVDAWEKRILPLMLDLCRTKEKRNALEKLLCNSIKDSENQLIQTFAAEDMPHITQSKWPYSSHNLKTNCITKSKLEDKQITFFFAHLIEHSDKNNPFDINECSERINSVSEKYLNPVVTFHFTKNTEFKYTVDAPNHRITVLGDSKFVIENPSGGIPSLTEHIHQKLKTDSEKSDEEFHVLSKDVEFNMAEMISEKKYRIKNYANSLISIAGVSSGSCPHATRSIVLDEAEEVQPPEDARIDDFEFYHQKE